MLLKSDAYPASLKVEYPKKLSRLTTFFRLTLVIPIVIILAFLSGSGMGSYPTEWEDQAAKNQDVGVQVREDLETAGTGIAGGLFVATALMIIFRQRYPKWWYEFNLELNRFTMRISAYLFLLTDKYPSTEDHQDVHLDLKYPNAEKDLNRWMPLIKWLLALPHYIALLFLAIAAFFAVFIAWFAILITGRYPKDLFEFVVGVMRWSWRVTAYAFLLTTDKYPPFSLK